MMTQSDRLACAWCAGDGRGPSYTFVYPNIMVNRYSLWMGTMRVRIATLHTLWAAVALSVCLNYALLL